VNAAAIARVLGDMGIRPYLRCGTHRQTCPRCSHERRKSSLDCLSVTIDDDKARWFCHHCGWKGRASSQGNDDSQRRHYPRPASDLIQAERPDDYIGPFYNTPTLNYLDAVWAADNGFDGGEPQVLKKIAEAYADWENASPIKKTLGETYVRRRIPGFAADFEFNHDSLRFEAQAWHPYQRCHHPALIAKVIRARNGQFCGVQRIYLLTDGSNRLPDAQRGRMSFGRLVNGVVKLSLQRCENGELVVVEGVVKGLAAIDCGVPGIVCATLGKDTMRGLPHLSSVTRLTIVPDNDDPGDKAAAELSHRYRWRGTAVRIVATPSGKDLDAFLRGEA
jgi:hypothetical protein